MATKKTVSNLPSGAKVYNTVLGAMPKAYSEGLPRATASNIGEIASFILDNNYQPNLNSFINTLINRIGLTIIHNKSTYNNPLARFKKGEAPLGDSIQELFINPAEGEEYDLSNEGMSKLLTITDPDTHVAYYQLNRKDKYPVTIQRETIQQAFVSWEAFEEFITSITNSLYSGNYIDEFLYTKLIIDNAYSQNKMLVEVIDNPVDEKTAKAFTKLCKKLSYKMQFPSTKYNAFSQNRYDGKSITTWTPKDRMCIIINSDVLVENEIEVLANAFNMSVAEFQEAVIPVDEFQNKEILAVVCDESLLQIRDALLKFDDFYNPSTMSHNLYLHAWSYFNLSPFANGVIIATKKAENKEVTEMSFEEQPTKEITSLEGLTEIKLTTTPVDTTSDITFTNENDEILTISRKDKKTVVVNPIKNGSSKITAKSDNNKTAEITVNINQAE